MVWAGGGGAILLPRDAVGKVPRAGASCPSHPLRRWCSRLGRAAIPLVSSRLCDRCNHGLALSALRE